MIRVVAAVIAGTRPGEVMAFRRGPAQRHAGLWEFPGGKVEPGEDDRAALARELAEELDVAVEVGAHLFAEQITGATVALDMQFYRCRLLDAGVEGLADRLTDHDACASCPIESLAELAWAPGDVGFVTWLAHHELVTEG